jgi:Fic family protein
MNTQLQNTLQEIDTLKTRLQAIRPLPIDVLKKIRDAIEIEYTYESNRIEGNTLTLQETALIVSEGLTIGGKSMAEHLEVINHAQAIEFINDIARADIDITENIIKEIHAIILHGINKEQAGKYRNMPVMIVGSKHIPPQPYLIAPKMEQFIIDYQAMKADNVHPVLIAAFLHDELVKIHPFIDGNGRTSRLLMNLYLISNGYTISSLKSDDKAKLAYYQALEHSHIEHDREPFYILVTNAVKYSLEAYIKIIEG